MSIDAFSISFYRSLIAAVTIGVIYYLQTGSVKIQTDKISFLASLFYSGILIFFVLATKMTTAANAIFLQFTAPIYLLFLEPLFLKTRFKYKDLFTVIICTSGMTLFFFGKLDTGNIYGNIFAIVAGICFALFSLFLKWKKIIAGAQNTLGTIILGNIIVSILCLIFTFNNLSISLTDFFILLYMGSVQIGISYTIFNEGIKYVSATESMIIGIMEAVFNPIWVFIGIGERPSNFALIGGTIIFTAIILHNISSNKKFDSV